MKNQSTLPKPISEDPLVYKITLSEYEAQGREFALIIFGGYAGGDSEAFPVLNEFSDYFEYDEDLDSLVLRKATIPAKVIICALTTDPFESVKIIDFARLNVAFNPETNLDNESKKFIIEHSVKV